MNKNPKSRVSYFKNEKYGLKMTMITELINLDSKEFDKAIAQDYLKQVLVIDSGVDELVAIVRGSASNPYRVHLTKYILTKEIEGSCTCKAFINTGQCKHIAAVVMKSQGPFFENWNPEYKYYEITGRFNNDRDSDYIDEPARITFNDLHKDFLKDVKALQKSSDPEEFYAEKSIINNMPHSIWYILDFYNSPNGVRVEFVLQCQSLLRSGKLGKIKNIKVDPETINLLPHLEDKEILNSLTAFARWEYSYAKNASAFHAGEFSLEENKKLFENLIHSSRALKRGYTYYDASDDEPLHISNLEASFILEVNSELKSITPKVTIQDKKFNLDHFSEFNSNAYLFAGDTFYPIKKNHSISKNILDLLMECKEQEIELTEDDWNQLQFTILKHVPHHLIIGDKFNLEIKHKDIEFEVYLKWEDGTNYIRGLIFVPESEINNDLIQLKYDKLENFIKTFDDFEFNENSFLFESTYTYDLCNYAAENDIPMFFKKQKLKAASAFNMNIKSGLNWLDLNPKISFKDLDIDFDQIIKSLDVTNNTVKIGKDEVGIIPREWVDKIKLLQEHAKINKSEVLLHPAKALILDEFEEVSLNNNKEVINLKRELENFTEIKEFNEEVNFKGVLRKYQRLALGWFDFLERCNFGGCLADDMGLGKTVQIIAHLQKRLNKNPNQKVLILCPKSLTNNWQNEFHSFAPEIKTYSWDKGQLTTKNIESTQIIFVSYQLLQRQKDFDYNFDYLILDEAQMVKNPHSLTHKAVLNIKAKHKLALTGTPVENHAGDLMSIFNIIIPGLFESKKIKDPSKLNDFRFLRPFILRRTKDEVLNDIPEKTIQTIYCEQSKAEKEKYLSYHLALKNELKNTTEITKNKFNLLQTLTKLRQAACHMQLIDTNSTIESSKIETLKEIVSEIHASGNKVIIFSQFTRLLKIVKVEIGLNDDNSCYLDGQTTNRPKVIEEFKKVPHKKSFLISIKAGGVGLNLTNANYCIILDPWWNPAVESQAIDRIHRIGQKNPVFAYRLITKDTIEEKVDELQKTKKDLYNKILDSNEGFIKELKKNDIDFLLT
jgi:SNF2 family DNA or RNA helicase